MAIAFVFPGQGSQAVGMGKALADAFPQAAAVFAEVDAALGQKLSTLMFEGPEADQESRDRKYVKNVRAMSATQQQLMDG